MKYPQKRLELKKEFYSKFRILEKQYQIVHSGFNMKFEKESINEIEREESNEPPESLRFLNSYIVNSNMKRREEKRSNETR